MKNKIMMEEDVKVKKGKRSKKKVIITLAVIIIFVGVISIIIKSVTGGADADDSTYNGIQAQSYEKHDLSTSINVTGKVESQNVLDVTTDLTCKVKELNVSLGDYVEKGDVLLVFDDSEIREQISELETQMSESDKLAAKELEIANRTLETAKKDKETMEKEATDAVDKAQKEYDEAVAKYNKLLSDDVSKESSYEIMKSLESSLSEAKKNLESVKKNAEEAVQSAEDSVDLKSYSTSGNKESAKELSKLYRQLEQVTVTAEQSGIVTSLNVSQGSIPNGILMKIEDNTNLKIKVSIKEKDIVKIATGMDATITSDALPDETYKGTVSRVINFASSNVTSDTTSDAGYSAEVSVENGSKFLLGMSAKVEMKIKDLGEKLSVPYDSIFEEEDLTYVYKAEENGDTYNIKKVKVTVGEESDYYTEVSSDELQEGDLIINYPDQVSDGDSVKIYISDGK